LFRSNVDNSPFWLGLFFFYHPACSYPFFSCDLGTPVSSSPFRRFSPFSETPPPPASAFFPASLAFFHSPPTFNKPLNRGGSPSFFPSLARKLPHSSSQTLSSSPRVTKTVPLPFFRVYVLRRAHSIECMRFHPLVHCLAWGPVVLRIPVRSDFVLILSSPIPAHGAWRSDYHAVCSPLDCVGDLSCPDRCVSHSCFLSDIWWTFLQLKPVGRAPHSLRF